MGNLLKKKSVFQPIRYIMKKEWYLLIRNKGFWAGVLLSALSVVCFCYFYYVNYRPAETNAEWFEEVAADIDDMKEKLKSSSLDDTERSELQQDLKIEEYCMEHAIGFNHWKRILVKYYFNPNGMDKKEYQAVKQAFDKDDWKIYYRYQDSAMREEIKNGTADWDVTVQLKANALLYKYDIEPEGMAEEYQDWRNELVYQYQDILETLLGAELYPGEEDYYLTAQQKRALKEEEKLILYRLAHNVRPNRQWGAGDNMKAAVYARYAVYAILLMLFVQIFVQEFDKKTIYQTLLLPYSRKEIYAAKLLMMLKISVLFMLVQYAANIITVNALSAETVYDQLVTVQGHLFHVNFYVFLLLKYLAGVLEIMVTSLLMTWFGICGFSGIFSVAMGLIVCYSRFFIVFAANKFHLYGLRFVPSLWFDWQQFLEEKPDIPNTSTAMGVTGTLIILCLLIFSGKRIFQSRDY